MMAQGLSASSITTGLATRVIGQRVLYYPSVASTMDIARREARRGAAEGTVVVAGEQTAGRGRLQRTWYSPQGNIALSLVLRPDLASLPCLVMIASLAVVHGIKSVTGLEARIKWPNDILIGGKKVCGILIENEVVGNKVSFAIIGIGINIALRPSDIAGIAGMATSLEHELGSTVMPLALVRSLLTEFERLYLDLPDNESIYRAWRDRLVTLGKRVTVHSGGDVLDGVAESVDETGALFLRQSNGSLTKIVAGDVALRHND